MRARADINRPHGHVWHAVVLLCVSNRLDPVGLSGRLVVSMDIPGCSSRADVWHQCAAGSSFEHSARPCSTSRYRNQVSVSGPGRTIIKYMKQPSASADRPRAMGTGCSGMSTGSATLGVDVHAISGAMSTADVPCSPLGRASLPAHVQYQASRIPHRDISSGPVGCEWAEQRGGLGVWPALLPGRGCLPTCARAATT
ncbi:hypothetical protein BD413DRAFT_555871 [Trametes elegans]|nr:hypothetical protein BD413DRAFT_555871 [Trametes elegans]